MFRYKKIQSRAQSVEKTAQDKKEDFISALKNQDLVHIKQCIDQEKWDINTPLEVEEITGRVQRMPLDTVLRAEKVAPEVLHYFMEKGANLELLEKGEALNLAHALCQRQKLISKYEVIKTLSENKEFVEQLKETDPRDGSTVLHFLAKDHHSQKETIEFLVKEHALNVNEPDHQGNTPLHLARRVGNAMALTSLGANYSLKNKNQSTPLDMEIENDSTMSQGERLSRKYITGGFFPISIAVMDQELKNNPHQCYEEIKQIFIDNTKESHRSFFLNKNEQSLLSDVSSSEVEQSSSIKDEKPRMPFRQLFERQQHQIKYPPPCQESIVEATVPKIRASVESSMTTQPEKTVKKSMFSGLFRRRAQSPTASATSSVSTNLASKEKKDRYAGCTWLTPPVAGPSRVFEQSKQEEQDATKEKKAEAQSKLSYSK
jgi:Ankyrin repeats (3 copies)